MEELFKVREKFMKKLAIATAVSAVLLTGCAGTYDKAQTGAVIGALTGTALAYGLGKDSGKKDLWLVAGAAAGGLFGHNIGKKLDERDRLLMGQTLQMTLEEAPDNAAGAWNNPNTGNSGSVTPTQTHMSATNQPCREFVQYVLIGGVERQAYGTACRQADGSWRIIQS